MKYKEKINILLGLILLLGPFFLFKTCNFSNNVMMCTYSSIFITAGGLIIAITNLVILKGKITNMIWKYITIMLFLFCILVPRFIIGGCENTMMKCNRITFPCTYIISLIGILINIYGLVKKDDI